MKLSELLYIYDLIEKCKQDRLLRQTMAADLQTICSKVSRELAETQKDAKHDRAQTKGKALGVLAFGWRIDPFTKRHVLDLTEQLTIMEVLRYRQGGFGTEEIADILNKSNILKKDGKPWLPVHVRNLLIQQDFWQMKEDKQKKSKPADGASEKSRSPEKSNSKRVRKKKVKQGRKYGKKKQAMLDKYGSAGSGFDSIKLPTRPKRNKSKDDAKADEPAKNVPDKTE